MAKNITEQEVQQVFAAHEYFFGDGEVSKEDALKRAGLITEKKKDDDDKDDDKEDKKDDDKKDDKKDDDKKDDDKDDKKDKKDKKKDSDDDDKDKDDDSDDDDDDGKDKKKKGKGLPPWLKKKGKKDDDGDDKEVKEGLFETHVVCSTCGSEDLEISPKGTRIRCVECKTSDVVENVVGIGALIDQK